MFGLFFCYENLNEYENKENNIIDVHLHPDWIVTKISQT